VARQNCVCPQRLRIHFDHTEEVFSSLGLFFFDAVESLGLFLRLRAVGSQPQDHLIQIRRSGQGAVGALSRVLPPRTRIPSVYTPVQPAHLQKLRSNVILTLLIHAKT
jgi:hypothetical protein